MLLIPTILGDSLIHGLGVFVMRDVKKGEVIWRFDHRCDFRRDDFPEWLGRFVFRDSQGTALDGDNGRFINHSDSPNLIPEGNDLISARIIYYGDELTVDYSSPESLCELKP